MEYSERYNQPEQQDEQLCERCQSLLGGQAAKIARKSIYRNNAFSYFSDDRTPEERAARWERLKRSMDRVVRRSGTGKPYSRTANELANRDRERILGLIDLLEKSSN